MNLPSRQNMSTRVHNVGYSGGITPTFGVPEQNMSGPAAPSGTPAASTPSNGR